MRHSVVAVVQAIVIAAGRAGATTDREIGTRCTPHVAQACSEAPAEWLSKLEDETKPIVRSTVRDDFRDPMGTGEVNFLGQAHMKERASFQP